MSVNDLMAQCPPALLDCSGRVRPILGPAGPFRKAATAEGATRPSEGLSRARTVLAAGFHRHRAPGASIDNVSLLRQASGEGLPGMPGKQPETPPEAPHQADEAEAPALAITPSVPYAPGGTAEGGGRRAFAGEAT